MWGFKSPLAHRKSAGQKGCRGPSRANLLPDFYPSPRPTCLAQVASVTRKVDSSGSVCFAGSSYRVGSKYRRRQIQVAVVGDTVEITIGNELIRSHKAKHDRTREHGALANLGGRPRRHTAA
jgi:hypothetical protein